MTGAPTNSATVTPGAGTAKFATDTDNLANLLVTKSDNVGGPSKCYVVPGQSLTYTIVVSNTGLGNATGVTGRRFDAGQVDRHRIGDL